MEFGDQRPDIDYPCSWEFRVIGSGRDHLMVSIQAIVGNRAHKLVDGHRKGKWLSLGLTMTVHDEAERNSIYVALKEITGVKMVL